MLNGLKSAWRFKDLPMSISATEPNASSSCFVIRPAARQMSSLIIFMKGKVDSRMASKVSLIEFRSNSDRDKAFKILEKKTPTDTTGTTLVCKRARTMNQKNRNDKLLQAEDMIKKSCNNGDIIKIEWKERQVTCNKVPAFTQDRDSPAGSFSLLLVACISNKPGGSINLPSSLFRAKHVTMLPPFWEMSG